MEFFKKNIKLVLLLCIPVAVFYIAYFLNHSHELHPTGFIQYDNVGYAAYAKQYPDASSVTLGYSNPFNDSPHYSHIYFQTQNIFLALLMKLGLTPGIAICLFSFVFIILTIFIAIALYDQLYPNSRYRTLSILLFVWGGGLLVAAGSLTLPFRNSPGLDIFDRLFYLDPAWGWWGLNFGRSLLFGVESYYHFLFFSALLFLLRKQWKMVCLFSFILSFSHPFTGIHLYLVLLMWASIERIFLKKKAIPRWFIIAILLQVFIHLYYYLVFLPSFPDQKSVAEQYAANWHYRFYHFIPAYILVFSLFGLTIYLQKAKKFVHISANRLLLCLAVISILLSNHELFMKPMQPIHFARGYEWSAYFLMGVPALHYLLDKLKYKKVLVALFILTILSDNLLWITNYTRFTVKTASVTHITGEQQQVLDTIRSHSDQETLIIGSDQTLPYLCTVYTKAYAWISHPYTTPYYAQKVAAYTNFINQGNIAEQWRNRKLIFIFNKNAKEEAYRSNHLPFSYSVLLETTNFRILETSH